MTDFEKYRTYILSDIEKCYRPMLEYGVGTVWETEKGEVDLEGRIDSLVYTERGKGSKRSESFAKRLFG